MEVTRIQYPIGQGCFHAGHVRWTEEPSGRPDDFHYVYDCGTSHGSAALRDAITVWRRGTSVVDALFVSHLDADHVSGMDRLLGSVAVDTVYISYLEPVAHVLDILEAAGEGAVSASLIEARIDPSSWFGRRGVQRIVMVNPSPSEGPPDLAPPSFDDDDSGEDREPEFELPRKVSFPSRVRSPSPATGPVRPELVEMESGEMIVVDQEQGLRWVFVPHVDPAPKVNRTDFRREVCQVLGLSSLNSPALAGHLAAALRDRRKRKRLRQCYERIVAGGSGALHNRLSMSLYSGPAEVGVDSRWRRYAAITHCRRQLSRWLLAIAGGKWNTDRAAVGWVGTGDASLKQPDVRAAWQRSYRPFRSQIATLLLPHHGSSASFHPSLLNWPNLGLCVASAADRSRHGHPHSRVVQEVFARTMAMHHVSQRPQTVLREILHSL